MEKKIAKRGIDRGDEVTIKELTDYLEKSDCLKGSKNFICLSWTAYPYSREMIRELYYDNGQYYVKKREGKIVGVYFTIWRSPTGVILRCHSWRQKTIK